MIEYKDIKNLEDLDKAHKQLQQKLKKKEKRISKDVVGVKDSFTPMNLFAAGLRRASPEVPLDLYLLNFVRKLKRRIRTL